MRRLIAYLLCGILILLSVTGCNRDTNSKTGAGHSFAYTLVGNPDTLDPQLAENASAKMVLANLFEGLFTLDAEGNVKLGVAKSYTVSDDGLHYTIQLREDSFWYRVDETAKASTESGEQEPAPEPVTAMDFVFAFQRMFDPLYHSPYSSTFDCLANAQDIINGKQDASMIGVYAKKTFELEIALSYPNANLPLLLTSTAALPCSQSFFLATKGRYGLDEQSIMGNGGFAMQRWLYDPYGKYNVIQLCRNPHNHAVRKVLPLDLCFYIEQTEAEAERLFTAGTTDCFVTEHASFANQTKLSVNGAYSMTLGLISHQNSGYGDAGIRQAFADALDRTAIAGLSADIQPAAAILPPAVTLLNKSCRELIAEGAYRRTDIPRARATMTDRLQALNLQELEEGKVLVPAGMMDYSPLLSVLEQWEKTLHVHMSIEEIAENTYEERLSAGDYTLALVAVSGDCHDASSVFQSFLMADWNHCANTTKVRTMMSKAAAAPNLTDCVELYRQAEEALLTDACFLPLFYKQRYLICKEGVSDIVFNPFGGQLQFQDAKYFE